MELRSGTINIESFGDGLRITVHLVWRTTKPLTIDNVSGLLRDLDRLGAEYSVTTNWTDGLPQDVVR
jgi:hypothetical protein